MKQLFLLLVITAAVIFSSCSKSDNPVNTEPPVVKDSTLIFHKILNDSIISGIEYSDTIGVINMFSCDSISVKFTFRANVSRVEYFKIYSDTTMIGRPWIGFPCNQFLMLDSVWYQFKSPLINNLITYKLYTGVGGITTYFLMKEIWFYKK